MLMSAWKSNQLTLYWYSKERHTATQQRESTNTHTHTHRNLQMTKWHTHGHVYPTLGSSLFWQHLHNLQQLDMMLTKGPAKTDRSQYLFSRPPPSSHFELDCSLHFYFLSARIHWKLGTTSKKLNWALISLFLSCKHFYIHVCTSHLTINHLDYRTHQQLTALTVLALLSIYQRWVKDKTKTGRR